MLQGPELRELLKWPRPLPLEDERVRLLHEVKFTLTLTEVLRNILQVTWLLISWLLETEPDDVQVQQIIAIIFLTFAL